ncbi:MAG: KH domain-containing protein [Candidatus Aenigmarchaeota archaeon]|nr:KH domain-containing protein [Candidatus Aenigmarchaeota archaeon]
MSAAVKEAPKEYRRTAIVGEEIQDNLNIISGFGTYRENSKIFSKYVGFVKERDNIISVSPLNNIYVPKKDDFVIGEVIRVGYNNWSININSPFDAMLSLYEIREFVKDGEDIEKYYKIGDILYIHVSVATKSRFINVSMKNNVCKKLYDGIVIPVVPSRVQRVIGRKGSMIKLITEKTGCNILVGQNGLIWIKGDNAQVAIKAIRHVESNFLERHLTQRMEEKLTNNEFQ